MFNIFPDKKIRAFGLDISDASIKTMQLAPTKEGFEPLAFSEIAIPSTLIMNHMIAKPEKLAESIKRAVDMARKIDTKYVVANVPEAKSFVRMLKIPVMSEAEIEGAIPWELEQDIPVPVDQVYLDWQLIGKDAQSMNVLVTATPKDYVDSLVDTLKLAGLKPVAFELESQATARALVSGDDANAAVLILDMSVMQTSFIIVINNGVLEYTSSIPFAGNAFTESIARSLGVSSGEAEKIKREVGLLDENKKESVRQAILPILDNIIDEIKNVSKFYEEHDTSKKKISRIYLCGGTAKLAGLADYISVRLNLGAENGEARVALGNPWTNLGNFRPGKDYAISSEQSLEYATAIGLALRGVQYEGD